MFGRDNELSERRYRQARNPQNTHETAQTDANKSDFANSLLNCRKTSPIRPATEYARTLLPPSLLPRSSVGVSHRGKDLAPTSQKLCLLNRFFFRSCPMILLYKGHWWHRRGGCDQVPQLNMQFAFAIIVFCARALYLERIQILQKNQRPRLQIKNGF